MGLLAMGLALATYGTLLWAGNGYSWSGDHTAVALAGSLGAVGLLMTILGLAGWRAGFLTFLAAILAISAWTSSAIPPGIDFDGRVGDSVWKPTSVNTALQNGSYRIGAGTAVLDLSGLPLEGIAGPAPTIPAYVGAGDLTVIVPEGLTVQVVAHVSLGDIVLPADLGDKPERGSDVSRSVVIGEGPTEVVVKAGVGLGQINVVKE